MFEWLVLVCYYIFWEFFFENFFIGVIEIEVDYLLGMLGKKFLFWVLDGIRRFRVFLDFGIIGFCNGFSFWFSKYCVVDNLKYSFSVLWL